MFNSRTPVRAPEGYEWQLDTGYVFKYTLKLMPIRNAQGYYLATGQTGSKSFDFLSSIRRISKAILNDNKKRARADKMVNRINENLRSSK